MALRGQRHRGRTDAFPSDKPVRAGVLLHPGDPVRTAYEDLVRSMDVSGAEIIREALLKLHQDVNARGALKEAG